MPHTPLAVQIHSITNNLTGLDIAVIAFPLVVALIVTLYMRRFTRSVADYLAAGRSAGRYLISTAQMEMGITAISVVGAMEVFSKTGFSLNMWNGFIGFGFFLLAMSGLVTYRFRETRALTFHQFFEVRYSKNLRVFVTIINVISSLLTMGIGPAIAARFFVYYLGLPPQFLIFGLTFQTFWIVMIVVTAISLFFAFAGGHLTIMTTDCIEGVISSFLYLVVAFAVLATFSYTQMGSALKTGQAGMSYLDPFDISKRPDFNYLYIFLNWAMTTYYWRGNAWNPAFAASAKSAHEGQMAVILGVWRSMAATAMGGLIGLGAFTLMHGAEHAGHADSVLAYLRNTIPDTDIQLRTQLLLPTALGVLLPIGVKGALCAVLLMGLVAGSSAQLHNFSGGLVQDVILPLTKRRLDPKKHVRLLQLAAALVAVYCVIFGVFFKIPDYIVMVTQLMSAVYLAGIGAVVWGGLYWKRGTVHGAWAAVSAGAVLAVSAMLVQQFWPQIDPWFYNLTGPGRFGSWLLANPVKFPINGQILSACIMAVCLTLYITISLLTCRRPYDMDKLLHRGQYRVEGENKVQISSGFKLSKLAGVNENFAPGDRRLAYFTFWWGVTPNVLNLAVVFWNLAIRRWSPDTWWSWHYFWAVGIPIVGGIITTIWFTWGVTKDMRSLFKDLQTARRDINDDGQVHQEDKVPEAAAK